MDVNKQNNKNQENTNISNFLKNSPQPKINPEPSDNLQNKNYKNQILNEQIRNSNPIISQKYNIPQKESNKILYNSSGDSEKKNIYNSTSLSPSKNKQNFESYTIQTAPTNPDSNSIFENKNVIQDISTSKVKYFSSTLPAQYFETINKPLYINSNIIDEKNILAQAEANQQVKVLPVKYLETKVRPVKYIEADQVKNINDIYGMIGGQENDNIIYLEAEEDNKCCPAPNSICNFVKKMFS